MPMQRPRLSEPSFQFPHLPVSSSSTIPAKHHPVSRRLSKRLSDPHLHHYLSNRALPPTPADQLPFVHSTTRPSVSSADNSPSKASPPRSERCPRPKGNCTVRVPSKKRRAAARRTLSVSARTCPAKWEGFEVRAFGGPQDTRKNSRPLEISYEREYPNVNKFPLDAHGSSIYCVPDRHTTNAKEVEKWLGEISVCPGYKSDQSRPNRKSTEIYCSDTDPTNWGKSKWQNNKESQVNDRRNSSEGDTSGVESNQTERCYSDKTVSLAREGGVCTSAYCSDLSAGVDSVIDSGSFHNSSVRSANSVNKNTTFNTGKQFNRRKSSPSFVDNQASRPQENRRAMNNNGGGGTLFLNSNEFDFRSLHRKHSSPANIGHTTNAHPALGAGQNKPTFVTLSIRQNSCATSGSEAFFNLALRPDARCDKITLVPAPAPGKVSRSASCAATLARKHSLGYNAAHGNAQLKNNAPLSIPKISQQPPTAFLTIRPSKPGDLVHDGISRQDGSRVTRTCKLPLANLAASVRHHQSVSAKRSLIDDWITDCHAQNSNYSRENLFASGNLYNAPPGTCAQVSHENVQNEPKSMTATHGRRKRSSPSKTQLHSSVSDASANAASWQSIEQLPVRESAPPYRTSSHADSRTEQLTSDVGVADGDVQKRETARRQRKGKVVRSKSTVYPPSYSVNQAPYLASSKSFEEAINPIVLINALKNHKNSMGENNERANGAFELSEAENSPPRYTQTPIKSVLDHLPAHSTLPVHRRQPHFRSMGSLLFNETEDTMHDNFVKPSLIQSQVSWHPESSQRTLASRPHRSQSMRHPGEDNVQFGIDELHYSNNPHLLSPLASSVSNFTLTGVGHGKLEPPQLPPRPKHLMCPEDENQNVSNEWVSSWCPGLCQWGVRRDSCGEASESQGALAFDEKNEDCTGIGGSVIKMYRGTIKSAVNCMFRKYLQPLVRSGVGAPLSNGLTADMPQKRMVRAMYDYKAAQKGDLSLVQDEEYEVLEETEEHWWKLRDKHGNEGYSPSNYVKESTDVGLHQYDWYLGDATRQRAETILMREEREGCFVVRNSSSTTGMYTISVYCSMSRPQVKHYHIQKDSEGKYYLSHNIKCSSISELIYKHQYNPGGLCTRLRSAPLGNKPPATAGFSRDKWDIPLNEITLLEEIGSGQFGVVRRGKYRGMDVAVKMMKEGTMSEDEFIEEAKVMTKLQHPNLVQLYGVCKRQRPVYIITEFLEYGSLLHYLRQKEKVLSAKTDTLIDMCLQICEGMAYLEKEKFIHRDLAARNCLVGSKNIKVGDFGLARYVVDDEYTGSGGAKFPIKWAAPEVLNYMRFSSKSDVWAFGVLMWEVFTCGKMPYGRRKNADVVAMVQEGVVLDQPRYCPHNVYQVMRECWEQSADQRPSFHDLKVEIGRLNAED